MNQLYATRFEDKKASSLTPDKVRTLLGAFHIAQPESRLTQTEDEAVLSAKAIGFPVVMKLVASTVLHKTEVGGVQLNLVDDSAVRRAFKEIASAEGVFVQKMIGGR